MADRLLVGRPLLLLAFGTAAWASGAIVGARAREGADRFLVSAAKLRARHGAWVLLDARSREEAANGTIPGAAVVPWKELAQGGAPSDGHEGMLRPPGEVSAFLTGVGADGSRPIAVFGAWDRGWGEEGRLFWTLEYLGLTDAGIACLDGGVEAWRLAGYPLEAPSGATPVDGGSAGAAAAAEPLEDRRASTELVARLVAAGHASSAVLLDTRDWGEFKGSADGDPYGARRSGHIPGAVWWPWRDRTFGGRGGDSDGPPLLRPCEEILASLPSGYASTDELVPYCVGGIRSAFVYMVLRGCGLGGDAAGPKLRNYDGSWWAWAANTSLPCEGIGTGCEPPRAKPVALRSSALLAANDGTTSEV